MLSTTSSTLPGLSRLALAAALLGLLSLPGLAQASGTDAVRVVKCSLDSINLNSDGPFVNRGVNRVAPIADSEGNDQTEEDQQPKISGSIQKPRGISEDDSRRLTPLGTYPKDQAVENALAALSHPEQRSVQRVAVEGENGWLVWSVQTARIDPNSGPDPDLEVKVDAGGDGAVLSIECD